MITRIELIRLIKIRLRLVGLKRRRFVLLWTPFNGSQRVKDKYKQIGLLPLIDFGKQRDLLEKEPNLWEPSAHAQHHKVEQEQLQDWLGMYELSKKYSKIHFPLRNLKSSLPTTLHRRSRKVFCCKSEKTTTGLPSFFVF